VYLCINETREAPSHSTTTSQPVKAKAILARLIDAIMKIEFSFTSTENTVSHNHLLICGCWNNNHGKTREQEGKKIACFLKFFRSKTKKKSIETLYYFNDSQ
jgi:hypothetical protein